VQFTLLSVVKSGLQYNKIIVVDQIHESVFLAGWPEGRDIDDNLLAEVAQTRLVVELGRQARDQQGLRLRQPLRRLTVSGAPLAQRHADEIGEELRVKEVVFSDGGSAVTIKPNLPVLGPRLGARLRDVQRALQAGEFEELPDGRYVAAGEELGPDEVLRSGGGVSVVFDANLNDELLLEGRVLDLIHHVNTMRREQGLEITDRIVLTVPQSHADVLEHEDWIKQETLAVRVETDSVEAPQIAKA